MPLRFILFVRFLRYFIHTLYFNFRYLPFRQARKLPILLYKPKFGGRGKYIINSEVKFGMIKLGFPQVGIFQERGIRIENNGIIEFNGCTTIGHGGALAVSDTGHLKLGNSFVSTCGGKFVCYHKITFGDNVTIGWNTIIMDTDFHVLKNIKGECYHKGFGAIVIGHNVWIGAFCKIYKNSLIPSNCVVSGNTIISSKVEAEAESLIYNRRETISKVIGFHHFQNNDKVRYSNID